MTEPKPENDLDVELENAEHQESLKKWLPYLWIAPIGLIVLLAILAYFGR